MWHIISNMWRFVLWQRQTLVVQFPNFSSPSLLSQIIYPWGGTSLCPTYLLLSTLAYTLTSVAQWGRLSHMITVQLVEASYSFTALCVFVSLFRSPHFTPPRSFTSKKTPSRFLINTRCTRANPSCKKHLLSLSVSNIRGVYVSMRVILIY